MATDTALVINMHEHELHVLVSLSIHIDIGVSQKLQVALFMVYNQYKLLIAFVLAQKGHLDNLRLPSRHLDHLHSLLHVHDDDILMDSTDLDSTDASERGLHIIPKKVYKVPHADQVVTSNHLKPFQPQKTHHVLAIQHSEILDFSFTCELASVAAHLVILMMLH